MNTPTPEEVAAHFQNAKEITCLQMGIAINIVYVTKFQYHEDKKAYTVMGGVIVVWNEEEGYAQIVKTKCVPGECKDCKKCNEKK
jgi:hypothetical protein